MKQSFIRGLVAASLALSLSAGVADTAMAGGKKGHGGQGVPTQKINVQLWTFAEYIGFGTDTATIQRTEEVFAKLRSYGYRNVEPFTLSGLSAQQYRDLLKLIPGVQFSQDTIRGPSAGGSGQDNVYQFDGVNVTLPSSARSRRSPRRTTSRKSPSSKGVRAPSTT